MKSSGKSTTKTKKSTPNEEAFLELEGNVYIVEKKNGKITSKEVLDGTTVLKCLLYVLEQSITSMEKSLDGNR